MSRRAIVAALYLLDRCPLPATHPARLVLEARLIALRTAAEASPAGE